MNTAGLMQWPSFDMCQPVAQNEDETTSSSLLVKECTCPETVLTQERIEKIASRARAYICTYHHIVEEHQRRKVAAVANSCASTASTPPIAPKQEWLYTEIERLI